MSAHLEQAETPSGHDAMLDEARRIVDAARLRGLTLRLVGGLAVGEQCRTVGVDTSAGPTQTPALEHALAKTAPHPPALETVTPPTPARGGTATSTWSASGGSSNWSRRC